MLMIICNIQFSESFKVITTCEFSQMKAFSIEGQRGTKNHSTTALNDWEMVFGTGQVYFGAQKSFQGKKYVLVLGKTHWYSPAK